jgi:hypothetical protein
MEPGLDCVMAVMNAKFDALQLILSAFPNHVGDIVHRPERNIATLGNLPRVRRTGIACQGWTYQFR